MFQSVLVANRGEIACRIFRTVKAMGLRALAVYSQADAKAKHVREADGAYLLGPAPAAESYLRGDRVLDAARALGAEAIHPGYGFLSENAEFAEAVIGAGLVWIGPTPAAIRAMGLKDQAKRIAIAAGVPVLSGYQGEDQSEKRLLKEAKAIGYPLLIKAVAGGGGRGIREVGSSQDFAAQLQSAQREAKAAFGDDRVLLERLVQRPRHIEVQVFGDAHGHRVHLFERDCSLQRRRQKVIEEAPAPGMSEKVREAMTQAALKIADAVNYENAGTVEFIVDGNGPPRADGFWFLEMNTRLQVEHPVTEAITGLDLVEWQLRVAAGEALPLQQHEIALDGHAIEARICAENPREGFRPSIGRISRFDAYEGGMRLDAGFEAGDAIPSFYDSLIAKAIVHRADRDAACAALIEELCAIDLFGVSSNIGFLTRCAQAEPFQSGALHTGIITDHLEELTQGSPALLQRGADEVADAWLETGRGADPWALGDGWRAQRRGRAQMALQCGAQRVLGDPAAPAFPNQRAYLLDGGQAIAVIEGEVFHFSEPGAQFDLEDSAGGDEIKAPLPGKLVALSARAGQMVKKGEALAVLEAMKMEHALKSPRDGMVAEVAAEIGALVKDGQVLVRLEALA